MLNDIHLALQQLLYTYARIDALEVDVRFETPTEEWVNSLTLPTISFFLFDIRENTEKRETNMQTVRGSIKGYRRMPPRRIDLFYLASVFCTEVEDEHHLLWRLLAALLRYRELPPDTLSESLKTLEPGIVTRVEGPQESRNILEVWNALGLKPHPAVSYAVTAPLDLEIELEAPLVFTRTARYGRLGLDLPDQSGIQIGGTVRNKAGTPLENVVVKRHRSSETATTNKEGHYVLRGVPSGSVTLSVQAKSGAPKEVKFQVPSDRYDIDLET
jgi:uncharacterized protein DUF4255/carboxypeptidase family protein